MNDLELLLVDDSPDDRALARRAILKELPRARFVEPRDAAEFEQALQGRYDAVLTDYRLGWSDGLQVLERALRELPGVPVIMLTNTGNEEVCAAAMKRGLADYLIKRLENYARLPQALGAAVALARHQADLERHRRALEDSRRELAALLEREQRAREDAEQARLQAQRANRIKDEFLATLSHELRTPLSAMLGWAALLQRKSDDPSMLQRGLDIIARNARAQARLIDDLLDMSRIVSGKLSLGLETLDVLEAVRSAVESARPAAAAARVQLGAVLEPAAAQVNADPLRVQQIVSNLLANAIKFTPPGGEVQVTARRAGDHAEIRVADTGIGIEPAFLPHVFDPFSQADSTSRRLHQGLGIGLAIVKALSELHGGRIEAHSDGPGRGAEFVLSLPLAVTSLDPEAAPPGVPQGVSLQGVDVLVVDDDADTRVILQVLLEGAGAAVRTADSAAEGQARIGEHVPDVVLSDIGMPGRDGYAFVAALRGSPDPRVAALPVAALTAFARSQDRQRALLAGFDMHAAKPIEPAELLALVAGLSARAATRRGIGTG